MFVGLDSIKELLCDAIHYILASAASYFARLR
jgi:hypothetical protein